LDPGLAELFRESAFRRAELVAWAGGEAAGRAAHRHTARSESLVTHEFWIGLFGALGDSLLVPKQLYASGLRDVFPGITMKVIYMP